MVHLQAFGEHFILRGDHVAVAVIGKFGVQALAWPAGLAVAYVVRHEDVIFGRVEQLARAEQFAGETGHGELAARAGGAVHDQDRVGHDALGIGLRGADEAVMQLQFRQHLAAVKMEVLEDVIRLLDGRISAARNGTAAVTRQPRPTMRDWRRAFFE